MKRITVLLVAMTSFVLLAPTMRAAVITFMAGDETVVLSSPVTVPITVSGFTDVTTFQFTLEWESDVIQFLSVGNFVLPGMTASSFGTGGAAAGTLTVSWDDADLSGETLSSGANLFDINYISAGSAGFTDVSFTGSVVPLEVSTLVGGSPTEQTFAAIAGSVNAVPEPALGVFAGLFVGAMALRRVLNKRASQPAS